MWDLVCDGDNGEVGELIVGDVEVDEGARRGSSSALASAVIAFAGAAR